ncbi:MAG: DMT family transporter [Gammaproteobacteria bacterium]|nr:DMT family transporter [Gammaproteobacteria bacterium]
METNQKLAVKLALFTVFLWSSVATAFKLALEVISPAQLVVVASSTSLLVLLLLHLFQSCKSENKQHKTTLVDTFLQHPLRYLTAGFINPILYYFVLFAAYDRLPAQIAQPINYTWAIVLSLLAVPVLKQRFLKGDAVGLVVCYLGVFVLVTQFNFTNLQSIDLTGVALAVISTILWACYWLINTKITASPVTSLLICFLCAIPGLVAITLFYWQSFVWQLPSFLASMYIGIFEMSLAFVFWLKAMRLSTNTAQISVLIYLSPFLSLVFIYFILGEPIHPATLAGLLIICIGLYLQKRLNRIVLNESALSNPNEP